MSTLLRSRPSSMAQNQLGATLLVAIVFLLVITILGIASMRGVSLESRITANLKQQKNLQNAAEAGIRIAENSPNLRDDPKPCASATMTTPACRLSKITADANKDTPTFFTAENAENVTTVLTGYATKIQWYILKLDLPTVSSVGNNALTGGGGSYQYFEVNSCASTVPCTSDTTTPRVMLRTIIARTFQ
jgi:type IV pilus assembly protein PilX